MVEFDDFILYGTHCDNPSRCIDYIFGLKVENVHYEVLQQVVVNEPVASDHLPVFVDIRIVNGGA